MKQGQAGYLRRLAFAARDNNNPSMINLHITSTSARRQLSFVVNVMKPLWPSRLIHTAGRYQHYLFRSHSTMATQPFDGLALLKRVDT
jgi:hypothetical protein